MTKKESKKRSRSGATDAQTSAYKKVKGLSAARVTQLVRQAPNASVSRYVPVGDEIKWLDATTSTISLTSGITTPSTNTTGMFLLGMAQGSGNSERVGQRVTLNSLQMRGKIMLVDNELNPPPARFHMWLIEDLAPTGAAPSTTDIFTSSVCSTALINMNLSKRFHIKKKWCEYIGPNGFKPNATPASAVPIGPMGLQIEEFWKLNNKEMRYSGTTGVIAQVLAYNMFVCYGLTGLDGDGSNVDNKYTLTLATRVRYDDR